MPDNQQRPFHLDQAVYPFTDHWWMRHGTVVHYLDEGHGMPVVMLHGNPTWSFLYRHVINGLSTQCRCIAPDYPGFGMSRPPARYGFTPPEHAEWINALIDHLQPGPFILVMQDWGGPIGLSIAVDRPDDIAGLVLCNTWCWPAPLNAWIFSLVMGGPLGRYLHLRHNFFARAMIPAGMASRTARQPEVLEAYRRPFPTPGSRRGTYVFPRSIRRCKAWLAGIESKLGRLRDKPAALVWGMKDPAFGSTRYIGHWLEHFPGAAVDRVPHASHYLPEDAPEHLVAAVKRLIARES